MILWSEFAIFPTPELSQISIYAGEASKWELPDIYSDENTFLTLRVQPDPMIEDEITYFSSTQTLEFSGNGFENITQTYSTYVDLTTVNTFGEKFYR